MTRFWVLRAPENWSKYTTLYYDIFHQNFIALVIIDGNLKLIQPIYRQSSVVSTGTNPTFKAKLVPYEYVPTMSKRLHFFGLRYLYAINYCFVLFV